MVIAYPVDDKSAEVIARQLCMAYDMKIGFSTWGMSRDELSDNAAIGCVSYAQDVGKAILSAKESGKDVLSELQQVMTIRELCIGTIKDIEIKAEGGFDYGITKIEADDGNVYFIDVKNENLIVRDESGEAIITVPESICMLDVEDYTPLTNADTKVGMRIFVGLSPAHPYWWTEDKKAYLCWAELLKSVGYTGDFVKYQEK